MEDQLPYMATKKTNSSDNFLIQKLAKSGMTDKHVYESMEISRPTFWRKRKEPNTFTLDEVVKLAALLHMDWKDLCENIYHDFILNRSV